ncbi:MAG: hypothetical protein AB7T37_11770, partial [Dehalococcoidia bacterium]
MRLLNNRARRIAASGVVVAVFVAVLAAAVWPRADGAQSASAEAVYLSSDPRTDLAAFGVLEPKTVATFENARAHVERGAWGVVVDSTSFALLPDGTLQSWFEQGIAIFGVGASPRDLREAIGAFADRGFADIAADRPEGAPELGVEMEQGLTSPESVTYVARTASGVYAERHCYLFGGGSADPT